VISDGHVSEIGSENDGRCRCVGADRSTDFCFVSCFGSGCGSDWICDDAWVESDFVIACYWLRSICVAGIWTMIASACVTNRVPLSAQQRSLQAQTQTAATVMVRSVAAAPVQKSLVQLLLRMPRSPTQGQARMAAQTPNRPSLRILPLLPTPLSPSTMSDPLPVLSP